MNPDTAEVETHMVTIADMQALKTEGFVPVFESGAGGIISGLERFQPQPSHGNGRCAGRRLFLVIGIWRNIW